MTAPNTSKISQTFYARVIHLYAVIGLGFLYLDICHHNFPKHHVTL